MRYEVRGRVVDDVSGEGLGGVRVEAWDKDFFADDYLGFVLRLQLGAPRMQKGLPVPRDPNLFVPSTEFARTQGKVVEVAFRSVVALPPATAVKVNDNWSLLFDGSAR